MDIPEQPVVIADPNDHGFALRPHEVADAEAIIDQCRDDEHRRWTDVPVPYRRADALDYLDSVQRDWFEQHRFALAIEVEGHFVGSVALRLHPGTSATAASLSYGVAAWARGNGYAEHAGRLLLTWAFDVLPVQTVQWRAVQGNWAARKVVWALGFTSHGTVPGLIDRAGLAVDGWLATLSRGAPLSPSSPWLSANPICAESGARWVLLRPNRLSDAQRIAQACSDPVSQRWLPQLPAPYTEHDALAFLASCQEGQASGRSLNWAVTTAEGPDDLRGGELLGQIGISLSGGTAEIGYWAHPDARGTGAISAGVRMASRHALLPTEDGGLGQRRVLIRAAKDNLASQRVALAAGFRQCGSDRRGEHLRTGEVCDMFRFDLLPHEVIAPDGSLAAPSDSRHHQSRRSAQ